MEYYQGGNTGLVAFDLLQIAISFAVGLATGLSTGILVEHQRLKHALRVEKTNRLAPHLEAASSVVFKIEENTDFVLRMLHSSGYVEQEALPHISKLKSAFEQYVSWYLQFQEKGMRPELESVDRELYDHLTGLFNMGRQVSRHQDDYISQNIETISQASRIAKSRLAGFW